MPYHLILVDNDGIMSKRKILPGVFGETCILNLHSNIGNPIFYVGRQAFLNGRRKA